MVGEMPKARAELVQELWKSLENNCIVDISHYNALLAVHVENEQPISLEATLADLESRKLVPNRATYQKLLDNYGRRGDVDGFADTMKVMMAQKIPLNDKIYNSMIMVHGFAG